MKLVAIADTHFSPLSRRPQSRTDSYHQDTKWEFSQFTNIVQSQQPEAVLHAGDIFHLKSQERYTPEDILYYREMFKGLGCPVYTICGNHDLPQSSFDNIGKTAYQTLVHATDNMQDISFKTVELSTVPCKISLTGVPYLPLERLFAVLSEVDQSLPLDSINIVMLHPDALPRNDFFMFFKTCSWRDLLRKLPHATILILGHIHTSFPILQTSEFSALGTPQFICKPWSLGRVVKDYHQSTEVLEHQHIPSYTQIQIGLRDGQLEVSCEYKDIPCVPFEQAFLFESLKREVEKSAEVNSFIMSLKEQHGSVENAFAIEAPETYLSRMSIPEKVKEVIDHYINLA